MTKKKARKKPAAGLRILDVVGEDGKPGYRWADSQEDQARALASAAKEAADMTGTLLVLLCLSGTIDAVPEAKEAGLLLRGVQESLESAARLMASR